MDFKTKQKLHKVKCNLSKALSNTWYALMSPIAWVLNKYDDFKYECYKKKIENLDIQKIGKLMAKRIQKKLIERPSEVWELYVCQSSYWSDGRPDTAIDHMIYGLCFAKGKYQLLYEWAYRAHYQKQMNDVWLNDVITRIIHDELYKVDGLDVYWEYETDLVNPWVTSQPIKDYQKHLIIKVKE